MKINLKIFLALLVILIFAGFFAKGKFTSPLKQAIEPKITQPSYSKVNLAVQHMARQIPAIVALKKGFYKKYQLEVNYIQVPKNLTSVLVSGKADAAVTSVNTSLSAAVENAPISWIGTVNNSATRLLVSTKEINEIKTVGIISGVDRVQVSSLLKFAGADTTNMTFQQFADVSAKQIALKGKKIDAITADKADWTIFKKKFNLPDEYKILLDSSVDKKLSLPVGIVVRNEFLKNNQKAAENLAKALIEADYWITKNPEEYRKLLKEEYKKDLPEDYIETHASVYLETLKGLEFAPSLEKAQDMQRLVETPDSKNKANDLNNFVNTTISDSLKIEGFLDQFKFD